MQRFVYASTIWVYGNAPGPEPHDEDTPLVLPPHLYTATKLAGEMYCRSFDVALRRSRRRSCASGSRTARARGRPPSCRPSSRRRRRGRRSRSPATAAPRASSCTSRTWPRASSRRSPRKPRAASTTWSATSSSRSEEIADTVRELVADVPVEHGPDRPVDLVFGRAVERAGGERSSAGARGRASRDGVRRYVDWLTVTSGSPARRAPRRAPPAAPRLV